MKFQDMRLNTKLGAILCFAVVIFLLESSPIMTPLLAKAASTVEGKIRLFDYASGKVVEVNPIVKSDEEWKKILTPIQFYVTRQKGTEIPFTGKYDHFYEKGVYKCVCCGTDLYSSTTKFNSQTGWPSFWAPISDLNIRLVDDDTLHLHRTEVLCARCGAHLGHVFDDGPPPTHKRHCMNSVALKFVKQ